MAKAETQGDSSPLVKTSGNMENRRNGGRSGDKRPQGRGDKCWPYPESNSGYVLYGTSLIFGSGYVDCTNVVRTDLARFNARR